MATRSSYVSDWRENASIKKTDVGTTRRSVFIHFKRQFVSVFYFYLCLVPAQDMKKSDSDTTPFVFEDPKFDQVEMDPISSPFFGNIQIEKDDKITSDPIDVTNEMKNTEITYDKNNSQLVLVS